MAKEWTLSLSLSKTGNICLVSTRVKKKKKNNPKLINLFWVKILTQFEFEYKRFHIQNQVGIKS